MPEANIKKHYKKEFNITRMYLHINLMVTLIQFFRKFVYYFNLYVISSVATLYLFVYVLPIADKLSTQNYT